MLGRLGVRARQLAFDAASTSGRHEGWTAADRPIDSDSRRQGARLRARSRDLDKNDMLAPTALRTQSIAGYGVTPHADTGDRELDRDVDAVWQEWGRQASNGTYHTIDGVQYLMLRECLTAGAAMLRGRARLLSDGLVVPLQLELLPIDLLRSDLTTLLPNGGRIIQGIELDPLGRIEAYNLWRERPGGDFPQTGWVRLAEQAICHLYDPREIGQLRGIPWLSQTMPAIRDLQLLGDALRTRAVGESSFMGVVKSSEGDEAMSVDGQDADNRDDDGTVIESFEPGMWTYLKAGQDVQFHSPSAVSHDEFRRSEMQAIAASAGVMHEQISGDLSRTNWTSYKAGSVQHRAVVRFLQEELLIPMVMRRVWVWFVDAGIAAGVLPERVRARPMRVKGGGAWTRGYPVRWELPIPEEVDREAEARATTYQIRNGLTTWEAEVQRTGRTPEEVLDSLAATQQAARERGIVLDCMPGMATQSGQIQAEPARNARP